MNEGTGSLAERGGRVLMHTYGRYPIEIAGGQGSRVVDSNGREYIDFVAGIAVNALGHGHPAVTAALARAATRPLHVSNLYWTEPMVRLAERLVRASGMDRVFFCNSGAEAVEGALKLSRKARPGRGRVVVFEKSFHGRTFGALSLTAQDKYQAPFRPLLPGVVAVPFGDIEAAAAAIDGQTAAVFVEPLQGEGGIRPAPDGFLEALRDRCDQTGALLVFDEIQCGIGRSGSLFAYQASGVLPDVLVSAKGLGGGLPIGALLGRGEAAEALQPGEHATTFGGGALVAEVADAVLETVLAPGFLEGVRERADRLRQGLLALAEGVGAAEVRGQGLMLGLVFDGPAAASWTGRFHETGVLTVPAGPNVVRFVPALTISESDIDEGMTRVSEAARGAGVA